MSKFGWGWWLLYHGSENRFKIKKEIKKYGFHNCPYWPDDSDGWGYAEVEKLRREEDLEKEVRKK